MRQSFVMQIFLSFDRNRLSPESGAESPGGWRNAPAWPNADVAGSLGQRSVVSV
jgi:hypothetical protein